MTLMPLAESVNVTLTLSAKGIKVIDASGIEAVVRDLMAKGVKL